MLWKLMLNLWSVVPEIKRYVGKCVAVVARFREQLVDAISQVSLVLRLAGERVAAQTDELGTWIVACAAKLDELVTLNL